MVLPCADHQDFPNSRITRSSARAVITPPSAPIFALPTTNPQEQQQALRDFIDACGARAAKELAWRGVVKGLNLASEATEASSDSDSSSASGCGSVSNYQESESSIVMAGANESRTRDAPVAFTDLHQEHLAVLSKHIRHLNAFADHVREQVATHSLNANEAQTRLEALKLVQQRALQAFDDALALEGSSPWSVGARSSNILRSRSGDATPKPTAAPNRQSVEQHTNPPSPQPRPQSMYPSTSAKRTVSTQTNHDLESPSKRRKPSPPTAKRPAPSDSITLDHQLNHGISGTPISTSQHPAKRQRTAWPEPEEDDISDEVEARLHLTRRRREARIQGFLNGHRGPLVSDSQSESASEAGPVKRKRTSDQAATHTSDQDTDHDKGSVELRHRTDGNDGQTARVTKRTRLDTQSQESNTSEPSHTPKRGVGRSKGSIRTEGSRWHAQNLLSPMKSGLRERDGNVNYKQGLRYQARSSVGSAMSLDE